MTQSSKSLIDALADTPAAALIARCRESERAGRAVASMVANLGPPPHGAAPMPACQINDGLLVISAASTAQAAKLRQAIPRFLTLLREQGFELSEIRIRVQPNHTRDPDNAAASAGGNGDSKLQLSHPPPDEQSLSALDFAEKLALTLRPSPLRDATQRLVYSLRRRIAHRR